MRLRSAIAAIYIALGGGQTTIEVPAPPPQEQRDKGNRGKKGKSDEKKEGDS